MDFGQEWWLPPIEQNFPLVTKLLLFSYYFGTNRKLLALGLCALILGVAVVWSNWTGIVEKVRKGDEAA